MNASYRDKLLPGFSKHVATFRSKNNDLKDFKGTYFRVSTYNQLQNLFALNNGNTIFSYIRDLEPLLVAHMVTTRSRGKANFKIDQIIGYHKGLWPKIKSNQSTLMSFPDKEMLIMPVEQAELLTLLARLEKDDPIPKNIALDGTTAGSNKDFTDYMNDLATRVKDNKVLKKVLQSDFFNSLLKYRDLTYNKSILTS